MKPLLVYRSQTTPKVWGGYGCPRLRRQDPNGSNAI